MDKVVAVTEYLRSHWKICKPQRWEKEMDLKFYERLPNYGVGFVQRLRAALSEDLK